MSRTREDTGANLEAWRRWGHLAARLDDLGRLLPETVPELDDAPEEGRAWYAGSIGAEFMHLRDARRRTWIADRLEAAPPPVDAGRILDLLVRADALEKFLQGRYVGTRRYSLEGADALIPLLAWILDAAVRHGATDAVLGMSHRGRINVMVQIVGRSVADILARFEDPDPDSMLGCGDVKYHLGATGRYNGTLDISLTANPSHLEAVDPVVQGRARARQDRLGPGAASRVLPVTLHGDAAFAGQGILSETLNLAGLPGYSAGGSIRILVNNLIGFTTGPGALHSSRYSSDAAKRLEVPVFHVNGEDPEAVVRVAALAADYRFEFSSDVIVDLISYRRHGHSEVDDPTVTQPRLYASIRDRKPLWELYAARTGLDPSPCLAAFQTVLDRAWDEARSITHAPRLLEPSPWWGPYRGGPWDPDLEVETAVDGGILREIGNALTDLPSHFHPHPKVRQGLEARHRMALGQVPTDWSMAEALALGSLLSQDIPVRLSGEDSRRGTFNQRHSVLIDETSESEHVPLRRLGPIELYDSPLSEAGVLGFEYGYSLDRPEALVLWEAQFGDFVNGAQVIIDQYLSTAEDKWGVLSGLVLLLPHGYEGQGPEHSSARLERFLQLAGEDNLQVCQPTTAVQYFHLLRRQALRPWRKPLVVLTPKSLLRNPRTLSPLEEFTRGRFRPLRMDGPAQDCRRMLLCTGKIAHELVAERDRRNDSATTVLALEQLYPFPDAELRREIDLRPAAELVWVQEEPGNMGALPFVLPRLERITGERPIRTVKRSDSASPATGSLKAHAIEQATLLSLAFLERGGDGT